MDIIHILSEDEQNTHLTSQGKANETTNRAFLPRGSNSSHLAYCVKKIEKPLHQTHGFCPLIYFLFIAQTVRVTGLRGRWARWWRIWCSSLRRCCKNFTAEHSGETMKTCSTFWQIRSGRWEKRPIEICFCHERAVKTSKLQSFIHQMKIMFSLFFFIGDALS